MNIAFNEDCMAGMRRYPDKYFSLAVCDPPYGIARFRNGDTSRLRKYGQFRSVNDHRLTKEVFDEIQRVSEHQIVWGYNHLSDILPPTPEFVFWYKHQPVKSYSDGELAWTSHNGPAKCIDLPYFGGVGADRDGRIHPTQKPVGLYAWLYKVYINGRGGVLDPYLGSGSSRIAAYDAGLDFVGFEIDKDYFDKQEARFSSHTAQMYMFSIQGEGL